MKKITVAATVEQMDTVLDFINGELENADCPMGAQMQIDISLDEIFSNIVRYAYSGQPADGTAEFTIDIIDGVVQIAVRDSGVPYNPLEKADPDVTLSVQERELGGLGIYMVKKSMDEVLYEHTSGQNVLTIRKKIN